ncbi:MAG: TonB-dependent receptor plug domain-containing protein, partial [Flavobacteriales bacterium]
MKILKQLLLVMFLMVSCFTFSQQINGVIVNESNQPQEASYVYNLTSKSHAHSLENGSFILNDTKINDSIKIGLLGYESKIILLDSLTFKSKFKVVLQEKVFQLEEMIVTEQLNVLSSISKLDLNTNPVNSSQEVLRKVPGLIIGQHAGGGKAEQLFLRGFDIDHGTDISISVDGMPVNMVSHAHGQGYSDLHFLIPETVNKIDFGKGPYYAKEGDFNTAAYVDFSTKDYLKESLVSFSVGQFNSLRTLGMFNL